MQELARDVNGRFARATASSPEMHEAQMRAALHHLERGDGGIESPGTKAHEFAGGVGRQAAGAGNPPRIEQNGSAGNFDAAGQFGMFQVHAHIAACRVEFVEEKSADLALQFHDVEREAFVAALGAHCKC